MLMNKQLKKNKKKNIIVKLRYSLNDNKKITVGMSLRQKEKKLLTSLLKELKYNIELNNIIKEELKKINLETIKVISYLDTDVIKKELETIDIVDKTILDLKKDKKASNLKISNLKKDIGLLEEDQKRYLGILFRRANKIRERQFQYWLDSIDKKRYPESHIFDKKRDHIYDKKRDHILECMDLRLKKTKLDIKILKH